MLLLLKPFCPLPVHTYFLLWKQKYIGVNLRGSAQEEEKLLDALVNTCGEEPSHVLHVQH